MLVVAVATAGRREAVSDLLAHLALQSRLPDRALICPADVEDVDLAACRSAPFETTVLQGPRGLTSQRNAILAALDECDIVVFFDDDFIPASDFLERCEAHFIGHGDVAMLTGRVILDGILGPGLTLEEAEQALAADDAGGAENQTTEVYNAYGCNMAFRVSASCRLNLKFDEALPIYGWLEDVDFSRGLAAEGKIVNVPACRGVHRGMKRGRTSGVKLGYSQIANPIYLVRKGRLTLPRALAQMGRNLAKNLWGSVAPEPWVDRRGRLRGNIFAIGDLAGNKLDPRRILSLG